jgi:hypothetical protein
MGDAPAVAILLRCPRDVRTRGVRTQGGAYPSSAPTEQGGAHEPESGTTFGGGIIAVETDSW